MADVKSIRLEGIDTSPTRKKPITKLDTSSTKKKKITKEDLYVSSTALMNGKKYSGMKKIYGVQQSMRNSAIASDKWYSGQTPTAREAIARMYYEADGDEAKFNNLYAQYQRETGNRASDLYSPYSDATNYKAIEALAALGYDVSNGIDDNFFRNYEWLKNEGRTTATGYSAAAPTKSSSDLENAAYWYYELLDAEDNTKRAESELTEMFAEVQYYAKRGYSDEAIMQKVQDGFADKYGMLAKMDQGRIDGEPVILNRALGYTPDTIYGMLYAARNNGGSGDYMADAVSYTLGYGNVYKPDPRSEAAHDPTSIDHDPYSYGSNMDDLNMKYGVDRFEDGWIDSNRSILGTDDGVKDAKRIDEAQRNAKTANEQIALLDAWIEEQVESGESAENIKAAMAAMLDEDDEDNYESDWAMLAKMERYRRLGTYVEIGDAAPFTIPNYNRIIDQKCAKRDAQIEAEDEAEKTERIRKDKEAGVYYDEKGNRFMKWSPAGKYAADNADDVYYDAYGNKYVGWENYAATEKTEADVPEPQSSMSRELGDIEAEIEREYGKRTYDGYTPEQKDAYYAARQAAAQADETGSEADVQTAQEAIDAFKATFAPPTPEEIEAEDAKHANDYQSSAAYRTTIGKDTAVAENPFRMTAATTDAEFDEGSAVALMKGGAWDYEVYNSIIRNSADPVLVKTEMIEGIKRLANPDRYGAITDDERGKYGLAISWYEAHRELIHEFAMPVDEAGMRAAGQFLGEMPVYKKYNDWADKFGDDVAGVLEAIDEAERNGLLTSDEYFAKLMDVAEITDQIEEKARFDYKDSGTLNVAESAAELLGMSGGVIGDQLGAIGQDIEDMVAARDKELAQSEARELTLNSDALAAYKAGTATEEQINRLTKAAMSVNIDAVTKDDAGYANAMSECVDEINQQVVRLVYGEPNPFDPYRPVDNAPNQAYNIICTGVSAIMEREYKMHMALAASAGLTWNQYNELYPNIISVSDAVNEYQQQWADGAIELENDVRRFDVEKLSGATDLIQRSGGSKEKAEALRQTEAEAEQTADSGENPFSDHLFPAVNAMWEGMVNGARNVADVGIENTIIWAQNLFVGSDEDISARLYDQYNGDETKYSEDLQKLRDSYPEGSRQRDLIDAKIGTANSIWDVVIPGVGAAVGAATRKNYTEQELTAMAGVISKCGSWLDQKAYNLGNFIGSSTTMMAESFAVGSLFGGLGVGERAAGILGSSVAEVGEASGTAVDTWADGNKWGIAQYMVVPAALALGAVENWQIDEYFEGALDNKVAKFMYMGEYQASRFGMFNMLMHDPKRTVKMLGAIGSKALLSDVFESGQESVQSLITETQRLVGMGVPFRDIPVMLLQNYRQYVDEFTSTFAYSPFLSAAIGSTGITGANDMRNISATVDDITNAASAYQISGYGNPTTVNAWLDAEAAIRGLNEQSDKILEIANSAEAQEASAASEALTKAESDYKSARGVLDSLQQRFDEAAAKLDELTSKLTDGFGIDDGTAQEIKDARSQVVSLINEKAKALDVLNRFENVVTEARTRFNSAKARVQEMYDNVVGPAIEAARQGIIDRETAGMTPEEKATVEEYLALDKQYTAAQKSAEEARALVERFADIPSLAKKARSALVKANTLIRSTEARLYEIIDRLNVNQSAAIDEANGVSTTAETETVERAGNAEAAETAVTAETEEKTEVTAETEEKTEVTAEAEAETEEKTEEKTDPLTKARADAETTAQAAAADPSNAKAQMDADLAAKQLAAVEAQSEMENAKEDIRVNLLKPGAERDAAVKRYIELRDRASEATQAFESAKQSKAPVDQTQTELADAIADLKQYTTDDLYYPGSPNYDAANEADRRVTLASRAAERASANADVREAMQNLDPAKPETVTAYQEAVTRQTEAAQMDLEATESQKAAIQKHVDNIVKGTELANTVAEARKTGDSRGISEAMNAAWKATEGNPAARIALIRSAGINPTTSTLTIKNETGATGNAGLTRAFSETLNPIDADTETQFEILDKLAKTSGTEIVMHPTLSNVPGARNGVYFQGNTIHIGLDALDRAYVQTGFHEITHWLAANNEGGYGTLQNVVKDALIAQGEDWDALVRQKMVAYASMGEKISATAAEQEIVAESAALVLTDRENMIRFATEDAEGFAVFKKKFLEIWERLKSIAKSVAGKNRTPEQQALLGQSEQLQKIYDNLMDAVKATAEQQGDAATAEPTMTDEQRSAIENSGLIVDESGESVAQQNSYNSWMRSDYVQDVDIAASELSEALGVSEEKAQEYIDQLNSIAKMIADDRARLDYDSSPDNDDGKVVSSFVSNSEYGGSFDFTTLCKKRRLLTGVFQAIQKALPNTVLTADEVLEIRNMMKERGMEVSCGLCYVEGSRAKMGEYASVFIDKFKQKYPDAEWTPTMYDVNTPDGAEKMRVQHPEVYAEYEYFWNHYGNLEGVEQKGKNLFASQNKPKLFQARTEYKGEVLTRFAREANVIEKNLNGGIRLQSFSDFETPHLLDTMQVILDMSRVGLAGQAYTKVPAFAETMGKTGLKINLSLIAKGIDENGKLIFDDVEGMPYNEAMRLRDKYSKNVGTILVVFNDEQLSAALADGTIDFIIPFHRSQWQKGQYAKLGLPDGVKDYTNQQNEKYIEPKARMGRDGLVYDKKPKGNIMPNTYWDFSKSGKENAIKYLELCKEDGRIPKFAKLLDKNSDGSYSLKDDGSTDGYWKLLIDFKMYDNDGAGSPQMPVVPDFEMDACKRILDEYQGGANTFPVDRDIVDEFVKQYKDRNPAASYSLNPSVLSDYDREQFVNAATEQLMNNGTKAPAIARAVAGQQGSKAVRNLPKGASYAVGFDGGGSYDTLRNPNGTGVDTQQRKMRNPVEITTDLVRSIRAGLNPGGSMTPNGRVRLPRAVLGFYHNITNAITTRGTNAGELATNLHEFGHAISRTQGFDTASPGYMTTYSAFLDQYPDTAREQEAIAIFAADYLVSPERARRIAGDDYVDNFEAMLRSNPSLNDAVTQARNDIELWKSATVAERVGNSIRSQSEADNQRTNRQRSWIRRFYAGVFDDADVARDLVGDDLYKAARYANGSRQRSDYILTGRLVDYDGNEIGSSLSDTLRNAGIHQGNADDMLTYAVAKQAIALYENSPDPDNPVLKFAEDEVSIDDLRQLVADYEARADQTAVNGAHALTEWWKQFRDAWFVNTNFMTQETADELDAKFPDYVPLNHIIAERPFGRGRNGGAFRIRAAHGSTLNIVNPIESIVRNVTSIVNTVSSNEVLRAFHEAYQRGGLGDIATPVLQDMEHITQNTDEAMNAVQQMLAANNDAATQRLAQDAYRAIAQLGDTWRTLGRSSKANVVSVIDTDGNQVFYQIKDEELFNLLSGSTRTMTEGLDVLRKVKNVFTKLTTSMNPRFMLKNVARDFQNTVNTGTHSVTYIDGAYHWARALVDVVQGAEMYEEWRGMGGGENDRYNAETVKNAEQLRDAILGVERNGAIRDRRHIGRSITNVLTLQKWNEIAENTSRYVEYRFGKYDLSTAEGRREAYLGSQNATTDFSGRGASSAIRLAEQVVPFMSATLNGIAKDINIIRDAASGDAATRTRAWKSLGKTVMNVGLTAALQVLLVKGLLGGDDDEDEYALLSEDMKAGNFVFRLPDELCETLGFDRPWVRIPIAQDSIASAVYSTCLDIIGNAANSDAFTMSLRSTAMRIITDATDFNPIWQPLLDTINNKTWYGSDIVTSAMSKSSTVNQARGDTPRLFIDLANLAHNIGIDVAPAQLQYLAEQYTGFIGKVAIPILSGNRYTGEYSVQSSIDNLVYSIAKNYTIDPQTSTDLTTAYDDAKSTLTSITTDAANGDPIGELAYSLSDSEVKNAVRDAEKLMGKNGAIGKANKKRSKLWDEYNAIGNDSRLTDGEKNWLRREIRIEINQVELDALAAYQEYEAKYINKDTILTGILNLFNERPRLK